MALWLQELAAFVEDPGSVPGTYWQLITAYNSSYRGLAILLLLWTRGMHMMDTQACS